MLLEGALTINPLNWKTDFTLADRILNIQTSFFDDATGEWIEQIPNFAADQGVLVVLDMQSPSSEDIDLNNLGRWSSGGYHQFDDAFFMRI